VTRAGKQLSFGGRTIDDGAGFLEQVMSPLSGIELAELASTLARIFPATVRWPFVRAARSG
jgi:hypothetical protein